MTLPLAQRHSAAKQALDLARRLHYGYGEVQALLYLAMTHSSEDTAQLKIAQRLALQALPLARQVGDTPLLIQLYRNTGHFFSGDADRALPYYEQADVLAKAYGQSKLIAETTSDLGAYDDLRHKYLSLQYYFESLHAAEKGHSVDDEVAALQGIGGVYVDLTDYEQALLYLRNALKKVSPKVQLHKLYESLIMKKMGTCYQLSGHYAQAVKAYQKALQLQKAFSSVMKGESKYFELDLEANLADVYERQGNPQALGMARGVLADAFVEQQRMEFDLVSKVSITLDRYFLHKGRADSAIYLRLASGSFYSRQVLLSIVGAGCLSDAGSSVCATA